jgi:hypothetical protein
MTNTVMPKRYYYADAHGVDFVIGLTTADPAGRLETLMKADIYVLVGNIGHKLVRNSHYRQALMATALDVLSGYSLIHGSSLAEFERHNSIALSDTDYDTGQLVPLGEHPLVVVWPGGIDASRLLRRIRNKLFRAMMRRMIGAVIEPYIRPVLKRFGPKRDILGY